MLASLICFLIAFWKPLLIIAFLIFAVKVAVNYAKQPGEMSDDDFNSIIID